MVGVKLKNVSVKFGEKFRHNQNYTLVLWKQEHGVDETTTLEDVKSIIKERFSDQVELNKNSIVEIVDNTDKE